MDGYENKAMIHKNIGKNKPKNLNLIVYYVTRIWNAKKNTKFELSTCGYNSPCFNCGYMDKPHSNIPDRNYFLLKYIECKYQPYNPLKKFIFKHRCKHHRREKRLCLCGKEIKELPILQKRLRCNDCFELYIKKLEKMFFDWGEITYEIVSQKNIRIFRTLEEQLWNDKKLWKICCKFRRNIPLKWKDVYFLEGILETEEESKLEFRQ